MTLPFVVRTVQPCCRLDHETEEAARFGASRAASSGHHPPEHLPGILSGGRHSPAPSADQTPAISGNLPFKTEAASVFVFNHIQSGDQAGAAAVAVVMLMISFAMLLVIGALRFLATRHERA